MAKKIASVIKNKLYENRQKQITMEWQRDGKDKEVNRSNEEEKVQEIQELNVTEEEKKSYEICDAFKNEPVHHETDIEQERHIRLSRHKKT